MDPRDREGDGQPSRLPRRLPHPHPAGASRHRARGVCAHMATPTHESYAAAKPSILAWLFHSADLGVAYGASHLTCAADLLPPKDALLPMGDVRDYSLFCTVDSDLPGKGLPVRNVEDTTFIDKQSHTALTAWLHDLPRWRGCFVCAWRLSRGASTPPRSTRPQLRSSQPQSPVPSLFLPPASSTSCPLALSGIRRSRVFTKHVESKATFRDYMARLYNTTASLFCFSHTTSMAHPAESSD